MIRPLRQVVHLVRLCAALVLVIGITAEEAPADGATIQRSSDLVAPAALDGPTIDTFSGWDGEQAIFGFGKPNTATMGQVITVPDDRTSLMRFRFYVTEYDSDNRLVVRGEVYAWDGSKAVGPAIWEGNARPLTLQYRHYAPFGLHVGGAPVSPGQEYVIFISISKTWHACLNNNILTAIVDGDAYPGGSAVWLNNGNREAAWTRESWTVDPDYDLVLKAWLR